MLEIDLSHHDEYQDLHLASQTDHVRHGLAGLLALLVRQLLEW